MGSYPRTSIGCKSLCSIIFWDLAAGNALADRYFQSAAGASSMNDMYLARGSFVFTDNSSVPDAVGKECSSVASHKSYTEPTIGDLLATCNLDWTWYGEGYPDIHSEAEMRISKRSSIT